MFHPDRPMSQKKNKKQVFTQAHADVLTWNCKTKDKLQSSFQFLKSVKQTQMFQAFFLILY